MQTFEFICLISLSIITKINKVGLQLDGNLFGLLHKVNT